MRLLPFTAILTLLLRPAFAQTPRWEVTTGLGALRMSDKDQTGWLLRQEATYRAGKRWGLAVGLGVGGLRHLSPLASGQPFDVLRFYNRQVRTTDLSAVLIPVQTVRHTLRLVVGVTHWRQRSTQAERVQLAPFTEAEYLLRYEQTNRLAPQAALAYQYHLSRRWGLGLEGRAYWPGNTTSTFLGLTGTYRFRLRADSMGLGSVERDELRAGLRLVGSAARLNGAAPGMQYRPDFGGGLWLEVPLNLSWHLQAEASYVRRGFRQTERRIGNARYLPGYGQINYLDWTLLFRHEVAPRWSLLAGPQLSVFLDGRTQSGGRFSPIGSHSIGGLVIGTLVNLNDRLALDARYHRDLLSLSTNQSGGLHSFQLGLSYAFVNP